MGLWPVLPVPRPRVPGWEGVWGALQDPPHPTLGNDLIWTEIPGCGVEMSLAPVHSTENAGFTQSCDVSPTS